jgi:hypothetical protein
MSSGEMVMAIDDRQIIWDFGFVDESEIGGVIDAIEQSKAALGTVEELQERLDALFNAVQPLLANLKKDPSKDYILWPDRLSKIEAFEDILQDIYQGKQ